MPDTEDQLPETEDAIVEEAAGQPDEQAQQEPEEQAEEPAAEPAAEAAEPAPEPDKPKRDKALEQMGKRIDEVTKNWKEEAREKAKYKELLEQALSGKPAEEPATEKPPANQPSLTQDDIKREAAKLVAAQRFDDACNKVYASGKAEIADFDQSLTTLGRMGVMTPQFLEAVTELDSAHKIIHLLGQDPGEAMRLASLPPTKMAIELARLENGLTKPKAVSAAPSPFKAPAGKAKKDFDPNDPNVSMEDYKAWFDKREQERFKNR